MSQKILHECSARLSLAQPISPCSSGCIINITLAGFLDMCNHAAIAGFGMLSHSLFQGSCMMWYILSAAAHMLRTCF